MRHFSGWGIWPAIGWTLAGIIACFSHESKAGGFLIGIGLAWIIGWFIVGLFKGKE